MRPGLGIRGKLLLLLFLASLVSSGAYTWFSYHREREAVMEGIDTHLASVAQAVAVITGSAYHDVITGPDSISEDRYLWMMSRLNRYAAATGMTYAYTYMQFGDEIHTTATNATEEEWRDGSYDRFYHHYDTASSTLYEAFRSRRIQYEDLTDSYGTFRTVFIPFVTNSGKVFVAGADLSVDFVEHQLQAALRWSILIGIAGFLVMFVAGHIVISRIVRPLTELTGLTKHLVGTSIAQENVRRIDAIGRDRRDEVGALAVALSQMTGKLDTYVRELQATTAAKERVEGELSAARDIQLGLLPCREPPFPDNREFELHGLMEPAKAVGGDLYDYFLVGDHYLVFIVGDVSGKGVPAALFMAVAKTLFKGNSSTTWTEQPDIAGVVELLNRQLCDENPQELFITVCAGVLDIRTGQVDYCDGGHDAPVILEAGGEIRRVNKVPGLVLGAMDDFPYVAGRLQLQPGDTLLLFTDGITEAMDVEGRQYGFEGLRNRLLQMPPDLSPRMLNGWIRDGVAGFAAGAEQSDDLTLLSIRYHGPLEAPAAQTPAAEPVLA